MSTRQHHEYATHAHHENNPYPKNPKDPPACDYCGGLGLQREKYRVIRMSGDEESRVLLLCANCRVPLDLLLAGVAPKKTHTPMRVEEVSDLQPSPTLKAQAVGRRR